MKGHRTSNDTADRAGRRHFGGERAVAVYGQIPNMGDLAGTHLQSRWRARNGCDADEVNILQVPFYERTAGLGGEVAKTVNHARDQHGAAPAGSGGDVISAIS